MYRIDEFLDYYQSLDSCKGEYDGRWYNIEPLPFYDGIFCFRYWKQKLRRMKDAISVYKGDAHAVTWKGEKNVR